MAKPNKPVKFYRVGTREIATMDQIKYHREEIMNPGRNMIYTHFDTFEHRGQYTPAALRKIADKMEAEGIAMLELYADIGYYDECTMEVDHARLETDKEYEHRMEIKKKVLEKEAEHEALMEKQRQKEAEEARAAKEQAEIEHYRKLHRKYRGRV